MPSVNDSSKCRSIMSSRTEVGTKVDGEFGSKKASDPRSYFAIAKTTMAERVKQAASDLRANGKTMFVS